MIVLRPGVEGNRTLGTHSVPGIYVKFQSGLVDVKEESLVKMMREHPCFGTDFIEVKQDEIDPFADVREDIEPVHFTTEIKYGHAEGTTGSPKPIKMTAQMKKVIEKEAIKMIPTVLKQNPAILMDIIAALSTEMQAKESAVAKIEPKVKTIVEKTMDPIKAPEPIEENEEK
jgi:hypothetical protein